MSAILLGRTIDAIAIGASAGGVEALTHVLPAMPARVGVAVFVVLHLPRERPSILASLMGARCAVPVREAEDKEPIVEGTIYVAPPDYHLLVERDGSLALSFDAPVNYSRPSIDVLLESAADAYGARLAGVVMTGANQDGALGLRAIARAGGVTIVQDPETAMVDAMPRAALAQGAVDHVLSLDGIRAAFAASTPAARERAA